MSFTTRSSLDLYTCAYHCSALQDVLIIAYRERGHSEYLCLEAK